MTEQIAEPATEESTSTEMAVPERAPVVLQAHEGGVLPIMPRNIDEAMRYASGLIKANLVPNSFKDGGQANPSKVLMGVLKAMEIGVAPQTGLAGLYIINDRLTVYGDLAASLVQRTGKVKDQTVTWFGTAFDENLPIGEWPLDYGCEVRYWRVGQEQPYIGRFSIRDAKRANLWMNPKRTPWLLYPKRMLFNRARSLVFKDGFADGLHGMEIAEELIDRLPDPVDERAPSKVTALLQDRDEDEGAGE